MSNDAPGSAQYFDENGYLTDLSINESKRSSYPKTVDEMLLVILASTVNIGRELYEMGDTQGANAIVYLIKTLEEFREIGKSL